MHRDRLELLIDVLENVAHQERLFEAVFDMKAWLSRESPCCTTACALGYAALDPRFQELGLKLVSSIDDTVFTTVAAYNAAIKARGASFMVNPMFGDEDGYQAGTALFDITDSASGFLFDPDTYRGSPIKVEHVIDRIHAVMDNAGDTPNGFDPDENDYYEQDDEDC